MHSYTYTHTCTTIHTRAHAFLYIHAHMHSYKYTYTCTSIHTHTHALRYIHAHMHFYAYTHTCTPIIHAHVHSYTYTYTPSTIRILSLFGVSKEYHKAQTSTFIRRHSNPHNRFLACSLAYTHVNPQRTCINTNPHTLWFSLCALSRALSLTYTLKGWLRFVRLLTIIGLFCRISSVLYGSFAKEACNF